MDDFKLLKQIGVNDYLDTENYFTALHFAAYFNRSAVVETLLGKLKAGSYKKYEWNYHVQPTDLINLYLHHFSGLINGVS